MDRMPSWTKSWWKPIESAPKDGTLVIVYAPEREGLSAITCCCAWHEDAGWCVDELRFVTHWMPLPPPPTEDHKQRADAVRVMGKVETNLRREERRHRDGVPSMRRDVADLLLAAADKIADLQTQLAAERNRQQ